jgi:hypothetical protein
MSSPGEALIITEITFPFSGLHAFRKGSWAVPGSELACGFFVRQPEAPEQAAILLFDNFVSACEHSLRNNKA